jgi:hypothetical protein
MVIPKNIIKETFDIMNDFDTYLRSIIDQYEEKSLNDWYYLIKNINNLLTIYKSKNFSFNKNNNKLNLDYIISIDNNYFININLNIYKKYNYFFFRYKNIYIIDINGEIKDITFDSIKKLNNLDEIFR